MMRRVASAWRIAMDAMRVTCPDAVDAGVGRGRLANRFP
jgi:hypothetical protein